MEVPIPECEERASVGGERSSTESRALEPWVRAERFLRSIASSTKESWLAMVYIWVSCCTKSEKKNR